MVGITGGSPSAVQQSTMMTAPLFLRRSRRALSVVVLAAAGLFATAGWGPTGHRTIADIAQARLTPEATKAVGDLLGGRSLAEVSTWADEIRGNKAYDYIKPWHYVNIQVGAEGFIRERDCPREGCVVSAIEQNIATLKDPAATKEKKEEALKLLVHFVGDLHQPLHTGYGRDRGGNDIQVLFDLPPKSETPPTTPPPAPATGAAPTDATGQPKPDPKPEAKPESKPETAQEPPAKAGLPKTNLHRLWDSGILDACGKQWPAYVTELKPAITDAQAAEWVAVMDPGAWATESFKICVAEAYVLPKSGVIDQPYVDARIPTVNRRISQGGVRLAAVLNGIFASEKTVPAAQPVPASPTPSTQAPAPTK